MRHLSIGLALLLGAACTKSVDTKDFEKRIAKRMEELGITDAKVRCPDAVSAKEGNVLACSIAIGGKSYAMESTITKVEGGQLAMDNRWKDGEAVVSARLEPALEKDLGEQFAVAVGITCGDRLRFLDAERKIRCELSAGTTKAQVAISFDDKLVPTQWALEPTLIGRSKLEGILTPSVRDKTSPGVTVTCGDQPLFPRPADGTVWCDIADAERAAKIKVELAEDLEVKRWEVATP
jgi:hypothetical protein